jgi:hypothetical protein
VLSLGFVWSCVNEKPLAVQELGRCCPSLGW